LPAQFARAGFVLTLARLLGLARPLLDLDLRDVWLGDRQRYVFASLDHVELARKQHHKTAGVADASSDAGGLVAGAPIKVRARRPDDGRARILRDHQSAERRGRLRALDRQTRVDEKRRAVDMNLVDRNGAAGHGRHTPGPDRFTLVRQPGDPKKYVRAVRRAHLRRLVGIGRHPVADALHRHFFPWHEIALDEYAPHRRIRVAVVCVVVDSQRRAVLEDDPCRTLDLYRQRFERIPEPADFELLPIKRPALDGAAIMVRHDLALFVQPTDERALVGKRIDAGFVSGGHEIVRAPVERNVKFGIGKARALDDRFVIAGEKPLRLAEPYDLHRLEIILEKAASGRFVG